MQLGFLKEKRKSGSFGKEKEKREKRGRQEHTSRSMRKSTSNEAEPRAGETSKSRPGGGAGEGQHRGGYDGDELKETKLLFVELVLLLLLCFDRGGRQGRGGLLMRRNELSDGKQKTRDWE